MAQIPRPILSRQTNYRCYIPLRNTLWVDDETGESVVVKRITNTTPISVAYKYIAVDKIDYSSLYSFNHRFSSTHKLK